MQARSVRHDVEVHLPKQLTSIANEHPKAKVGDRFEVVRNPICEAPLPSRQHFGMEFSISPITSQYIEPAKGSSFAFHILRCWNTSNATGTISKLTVFAWPTGRRISLKRRLDVEFFVRRPTQLHGHSSPHRSQRSNAVGVPALLDFRHPM